MVGFTIFSPQAVAKHMVAVSTNLTVSSSIYSLVELIIFNISHWFSCCFFFSQLQSFPLFDIFNSFSPLNHKTLKIEGVAFYCLYVYFFTF